VGPLDGGDVDGALIGDEVEEDEVAPDDDAVVAVVAELVDLTG
jgi:hypothetical protein